MQHHTAWPLPFIANGLIGFGLAAIPTVMFTYCRFLDNVADNLVVDAYAPIAPELLLIVSGLKQIFAFGLSYGVVPWITEEGYAKAFGEMAGIQVGIMMFGIPLYYFGKQIRHTSADWKLIIW